MASASPVSTDWTTCPICMEVFTNPKALPCIHGFCLRCLQRYYERNLPGDWVPCPLCKKLFRIPQNGLAGLQHHFFIQHLVDARNVARRLADAVTGEISLEENEDCSRSTEDVPVAAMHCTKHEDKEPELYCYDCNENVCVLCFEAEHKNHKSDQILEATATLRPIIEKDAQEILSSIGDVQLHFELTECKASLFARTVDCAKERIIDAGEWIKRLADTYVVDYLDELDSVKSDSDKQLEIVQEQLQLQLVGMESFHTYSRELLDKGRPCDVTQAAKELHKRATELLDNYGTSVQYYPPDVTFTSHDIPKLTPRELIGELTVTNSGNSPVGRILHTLPEGHPVWGVTLLRGLLYVLRNKTSQQISVYDTDYYLFQRHINIPQLDVMADMTVCARNKCLYVAGHVDIHRVALSNETVTKWPVHDEPYGLSVTGAYTLLVTCYGVGKIKEFTTRGQLLRDFKVSQCMASLWHTIQLSSSELIVCYGCTADRLGLHTVCLVAPDCKVVKSFGGPRGSGTQQLYTPTHLAVDKNGFVYVADSNNCRVLLLSPEFTYVCEVVSREQLKGEPQRLFLDNDRRRLYVALRTGQVVIVIIVQQQLGSEL